MDWKSVTSFNAIIYALLTRIYKCITDWYVDVIDLLLELICRWDVLPSGQEDFFVHHAIFSEKHVSAHQRGKVEDVDVVF